jgi:hypothetical protein
MLLGLVSISLILSGVASMYASPCGSTEQSVGLGADALVKSFGRVHVGNPAGTTFVLTNYTERPIRLLGATKSCTHGGCTSAENLPITIPPHQSGEVILRLETSTACDYRGGVILYTDCPGRSRIALELFGVIDSPKERSPTG